MPKVSIIVPVYNAEKYIGRCVNSLKNQTLEDIEIILVDDSSKDASYEMCCKMAEEDSRIKVLHKENEGAGKARNAALEIATGEYIGFVDSDDFVDCNMFKTLCDKAEEYNSDLVMSGVVHVGGSMFQEDGELETKTYFSKDTHFDTQSTLKELKLGIVGAKPEDYEDSKYGMSIWKNLFKHDVIKKNNLKFESEREMLSEDALFMVDYISCINKATGIKDAFYNYCRNGDSISKSYKKDRFEKSLVFANEAEKRFKKDIEQNDYQIYIDRFWQAICRVICSQEVMYAMDNNIKFADLVKRLKKVCTHSRTKMVLKTYPLHKLPLKQMLFAYCMKYRLYMFLKILVILRNK